MTKDTLTTVAWICIIVGLSITLFKMITWNDHVLYDKNLGDDQNLISTQTPKYVWWKRIALTAMSISFIGIGITILHQQ